MKKKRIVKLEPQTVELFAEVLSKLRPPPPLTVSQWADRYRVLSAESSAEPGRWHTEKAPYQRAIMDAIGDPHVRSVVVMSAAQIGKTDAFILNPLGYYMDYAKETIGKNLDFTVGGDVTFKVGASTVKVCQSGTIEITGTTVKITGATVNISGGSGDCKINGVSLVNHKHEHDGSAKAGPYTVSGNTGVPVK